MIFKNDTISLLLHAVDTNFRQALDSPATKHHIQPTKSTLKARATRDASPRDADMVAAEPPPKLAERPHGWSACLCPRCAPVPPLCPQPCYCPNTKSIGATCWVYTFQNALKTLIMTAATSEHDMIPYWNSEPCVGHPVPPLCPQTCYWAKTKSIGAMCLVHTFQKTLKPLTMTAAASEHDMIP